MTIDEPPPHPPPLSSKGGEGRVGGGGVHVGSGLFHVAESIRAKALHLPSPRPLWAIGAGAEGVSRIKRCDTQAASRWRVATFLVGVLVFASVAGGHLSAQETPEEIGTHYQAVDFRPWNELTPKQQALLKDYFQRTAGAAPTEKPSLGKTLQGLAGASVDPSDRDWRKLTLEHNDYAAAFLALTHAHSETWLDLGGGNWIHSLDITKGIDELHGDRVYFFVDAGQFQQWRQAGGGFKIERAGGETETGNVRFDKGDIGGSLHRGYDTQCYTSVMNVPRLQWNYRLEGSIADMDIDAYAPWKGVIPNPRHLTYVNSDPRQWRPSYVRKFGEPGFEVKKAAVLEAEEKAPAPPSTLSTEQARDAVNLADQFLKQAGDARDLQPVVKNLFASDFLDRYLADKSNNPLTNLAPDAAAQLSHQDLERFFALTNNLYSLEAANPAASASLESLLSAASVLLPDDLAKMLKSNLTGAAASPIASADQLRSLLGPLGDAVSTLAQQLPAGLMPPLPAGSAAAPPRSDDLMKPWAVKCDQPCFGYPAGTELTAINVPLYQLLMVKDKGQMKILSMVPR